MINWEDFVLKTIFFFTRLRWFSPPCHLQLLFACGKSFSPSQTIPFTFTGITAAFYYLFIFIGSILRFSWTKEWYSLPEEVTVRLVLVSAPPSWHLLMLHLHFLSWATTVPKSWTCLKALWPGNCFILADSAIPNLPDAGSAEACGGMGGENWLLWFFALGFFPLVSGNFSIPVCKYLMCWVFSSIKHL